MIKTSSLKEHIWIQMWRWHTNFWCGRNEKRNWRSWWRWWNNDNGDDDDNNDDNDGDGGDSVDD